MRKKTTAICAGLFVGILPVSMVYAEMPAPTEAFYVNDYAEVLSDTQEEKLCKEGEALYAETTAQIVLLTVDATEDQSIADFADAVGKQWEIGAQEENNGVLIVLSAGDRSAWITAGKELESRLTDSKIEQILNEYAVPYYKEDDLAKGTIETYYAVLNEVREEYGLDPVAVPEMNNELTADGENVILDETDSDDVELRTLLLSFGAVFLMLFLGYVLVTSIPLFIVINAWILLRGMIYKLLGHGGSDSRSKGYLKKYYNKEAVLERIYCCLDWSGVLIDLVRSRKADRDEDDEI